MIAGDNMGHVGSEGVVGAADGRRWPRVAAGGCRKPEGLQGLQVASGDHRGPQMAA